MKLRYLVFAAVGLMGCGRFAEGVRESSAAVRSAHYGWQRCPPDPLIGRSTSVFDCIRGPSWRPGRTRGVSPTRAVTGAVTFSMQFSRII